MILPPATLGLLGGGQLGRYFVVAAHELGYRVAVLDPDAQSCAGRIADEHIVAEYDDPPALDRLSSICAAVTTEFESVPASALVRLSETTRVCPSAEAVAISQERSAEKRFLRTNELPHVPYAEIRSAQDIDDADPELFPGILKIARLGYDGKGQARVSGKDEARAAFAQFFGEPCVLEHRLTLDGELSLVIARSETGEIQCFPPIENRHQNGILDCSMIPLSDPLGAFAQEAAKIAETIITRLGYVGTMAVEFFVAGGRLYVNELAPRPHNSGHFTLDACSASQFEQQVRALCGLPLAAVRQHSFAVMVNLLGDLWFRTSDQSPREPDWSALLTVPELKLHLYGKTVARPGRKMGHFTVTGNEYGKVLALAQSSRAAIGIRN